MKLGTESRAKVIALAVLGGISVLTVGRAVWPSSSAPAPIASPTATPNPARPAQRRTPSGKFVKASEPRLDPTLDLDLLRQSEQIKYAGTARNIFVAGSLPEIEQAKANGTTDKPVYTPPIISPPQPINLKFYGFASKPGEPKRVFLSQGEDIFIASEGDIVNRRYRVVHISPASVDIEDVLNSNRQSIPLTQG